MKTKKQIFALAALAVTAALTGCSSELQVENTLTKEVQPQEAKTYTVVINASKPGNDALTRAVTESGGSLSTSWAPDEKVYAYIEDTGDPVSVTLTADDINPTDSKLATLRFTFTKEGGFSENDQIVLYYLKPKTAYGTYTGQVGTLDDIAANFDFMKATVTVTAVNPNPTEPTDNILATTAATFVRQQAITKFTIQKKSDNSSFAIDPVTIQEAGLGTLTVDPTSETAEIWVALPGRASDDAAATKTYKFESTSESKKYGASKSVDLVNNKFYTATLTMGRDAQKLNLGGIPTGVNASQPYGGSAINVGDVTSGDDSPEGLTPGTDYDVVYKKWNTGSEQWEDCDADDVEDAGMYKVIVTGKGDYEGTLEQEFEITKTPTVTVQTAITNGTIDDGALITQGTPTKIVPDGSNVLGMDAAGLKEYATIATTVPTGASIATINDDGEIVTTGGGIITLTITLPEGTNYEGATVIKTFYVKQSGISGTLPDPTTGTW